MVRGKANDDYGLLSSTLNGRITIPAKICYNDQEMSQHCE